MFITLDRLVDEVMRAWPATIKVFLGRKMHCVGCPVGRIHTIDDACLAHDIDPDAFMQELEAVRRRAEDPAREDDAALARTA
ncbi:DUF1858 domain-containing protein [Faunimonas sp. B44]|uniref:DUF1858 domain-containing protein n=1 Tax=Faunimonas sp. B44 TaxID=3461493 RepID=UPI00404470B9